MLTSVGTAGACAGCGAAAVAEIVGTGSGAGGVVAHGTDGGVVAVAVDDGVVGGARQGSAEVSTGLSVGARSGAVESVVVVGAAGLVVVGCASAADSPAAILTTAVPATTHRPSHLCRDMKEPR
ncbi:hypothetical protein NXT08_01835 [Rhodococcus pyridinivorans]|uniref:hypothetical protein n=1 Tax=Rhodococcus pyridinivorans TaxID=103816 RepID=UPI0021643D62|nr:hypothetical protein [Rhodococcus pyridinivorans]UVT25433.1 hypothetical protein NXT08_01835 [Rhodococcus pyridinivorans]